MQQLQQFGEMWADVLCVKLIATANIPEANTSQATTRENILYKLSDNENVGYRDNLYQHALYQHITQ